MARVEPETDEALEALLEYVKASRGFDFSGYKRTSLARRIVRRMQDVRCDSFGRYLDYLEANPAEFTDLFNTILINVTGFFRDKQAWRFVGEHVIPALIETKGADDQIRIWSAGCASGEEPYSLAMLLAEALGEKAFRERVKIYATDVDEPALAVARAAIYRNDALKAVPRELMGRYFEPNAQGRVFRADLRRSVIFGRNDLVQDAPISRVDLLVSRNTLMYFTPDTQARMLRNFNFALNDTGFLFLGKSEMLITHTDLFTPYNVRWRVFKKVPRAALRDRLYVIDQPLLVGSTTAETQRDLELRAGAADATPVAQILLDREGAVAAINQKARSLFSLGLSDVGRPLQDLELSYRPADVRSALERAYEERVVVQLGRFRFSQASGEEAVLAVDVRPLVDNEDNLLGAILSFDDVTEDAQLDVEHQRAKRQLESAYEELQTTVEELETTNEELQSTNEELETTNEELQSTNEELETMNEELQSTNDELEVMNEEQTSRSVELDRSNLFLEGILGSLGVGVVVIDSEQRVQVWNASSADLWGLRSDEAEGEHLLGLDIGLPVERLSAPVKKALGNEPAESELKLEAVNRRGRPFECHVRVLPLRAQQSPDKAYGALLIMSGPDGQPPAA